MADSSLIHANQIGSMIGAFEPQRQDQDKCPVCGNLKAKSAARCMDCKNKRPVKRSAAARDNHRRYNAALLAGWTEMQMLIAKCPPTWGEIKRQAAANLITSWWENSQQEDRCRQ